MATKLALVGGPTKRHRWTL